MVGRIWRGRVKATDLAEYREHIRNTGLRDYRATPGNRFCALFTKIDGDEAEVITVSLWDNMESIQAFAGPDPALARYYPEVDHFLIEKPRFVEHYEVDLP